MSSRNLCGLPRVLVLARCTTVLAGSLRIGVSVPGSVPWASSRHCPIFQQRVLYQCPKGCPPRTPYRRTSENSSSEWTGAPNIGPRPVDDNRLRRRACIQASMRVGCVILVTLGKFDEYAWLFAYRPRMMPRWQHHDVARPELLLRTIVHHHL